MRLKESEFIMSDITKRYTLEQVTKLLKNVERRSFRFLAASRCFIRKSTKSSKDSSRAASTFISALTRSCWKNTCINSSRRSIFPFRFISMGHKRNTMRPSAATVSMKLQFEPFEKQSNWGFVSQRTRPFSTAPIRKRCKDSSTN